MTYEMDDACAAEAGRLPARRRKCVLSWMYRIGADAVVIDDSGADELGARLARAVYW